MKELCFGIKLTSGGILVVKVPQPLAFQRLGTVLAICSVDVVPFQIYLHFFPDREPSMDGVLPLGLLPCFCKANISGFFSVVLISLIITAAFKPILSVSSTHSFLTKEYIFHIFLLCVSIVILNSIKLTTEINYLWGLLCFHTNFRTVFFSPVLW